MSFNAISPTPSYSYPPHNKTPEAAATGPNRPSKAEVNTSVPPSPSGPDLSPSSDSIAAHPLSTVKGVIRFMRQSTDSANWNARCDKVKAANGGQYPGFWYAAIILGGELGACQKRWKEREAVQARKARGRK